MYVINARNVNDAYVAGHKLINEAGQKRESRAGDVLRAPLPVTTIYHRPTERVLFDEIRDANPFFHVAESVWMLAGMRDARWLDQFVRDFSSRYAEENGDMHGAYGYRWRRHFNIDQIDLVIEMLKKDPNTRRAVISMWDPYLDLGVQKKDIPCNDLIMFSADQIDGNRYALRMTVCCRSNDMLMGCYGANVVHMSILQEVIASAVGMEVGIYYQISNDFHMYLSTARGLGLNKDFYQTRELYVQPVYSPRITSMCHKFVTSGRDTISESDSPWLAQTVGPMMDIHETWRESGPEAALQKVNHVRSEDWRMAAEIFLYNRLRRSKMN